MDDSEDGNAVPENQKNILYHYHYQFQIRVFIPEVGKRNDEKKKETVGMHYG